MIASPRTCLMAGKGIHRRRTPERHRRRRRRRRRRHHPTDSAPKPDGCESGRGTRRKNQPGRNARDKQLKSRRVFGNGDRQALFFAAHPSTLKPFSILKGTPRAPANGTQQSNTGSTFVTRVVLHVWGVFSRKTRSALCAVRITLLLTSHNKRTRRSDCRTTKQSKRGRLMY